MAKDVMRATSCSLCDQSPCDLRIRSAWVDEAHLASMCSIWAPMDKLDCSTTPNTRKVLTCSATGTTGPSGLMSTSFWCPLRTHLGPLFVYPHNIAHIASM